MPWLSAVSATTELFVTAAVFYVLYMAIARDQYKWRILGLALGYEILFNISYMTFRLFTHAEPSHHPPWMVAIVALHGILSLAMFLALIAFTVVAYRRYVWKQQNFFREHRVASQVFAGFWVLALASGYAIFFLEYVGHV